MAIDVSAPRSHAARFPLGLARLVAIPAQAVLAGIVGASFLVRLAASLDHTIPLYFPDEYIYSSLARSLAESGQPLIRHSPAHFPALLEPLLAAPFWLTHDPSLAFRLTQAENALAMSVAAVPVFLLCRRVGLGKWIALTGAAVAVASPDLFFVSFVLADPLAYPLALGAIYAAVCALERPTWRSQAIFLGCASLATLARIQYALLPLVFLAGTLIVERGRWRGVLARFRLTLVVLVLPLIALLALGPSRALGYYDGIVSLHVRPGALAHWVGTDAMLLTYCAGWVLVPGALVGLAAALVRPRSRAESAFAAVTVALTGMLFAETALYASNGSGRFQERYFMALLPLVVPWFGLYLRRGLPGRLVVALMSVCLIALSARVPLSGYSAADNKQDSPFLLGVFRLERALGIGTGSLAIAICAAVLSGLAAAVAFRARLAPVAFAVTLAVAGSASAASISFDHHAVKGAAPSLVAADKRWIDHSRLRHVVLIHTPGTLHARTHEQLFWNTSIDNVYFFDHATAIDAFGSRKVEVDAHGRFVVGGRVLRSPLAISTFAVRVSLRDATRVAQAVSFELWRPEGTPRLSLFVGGLYHDRWLSQAGHISVWPARGDRVQGSLRLALSLPKGTERTVLLLAAPGFHGSVTVLPAHRRVVTIRAEGPGPWTLRFHTDRPGYLGDGRPVSVQAALPVFSPAKAH